MFEGCICIRLSQRIVLSKSVNFQFCYIDTYFVLKLVNIVVFEQTAVHEVSVINKRNLGKMIVQHIGHEGVEKKQNLRRLLQACIDYLQNEKESFWENASFTIYDEDDNMYKIASGKRKHQFICRLINGEPVIRDKNGGRIMKSGRDLNDGPGNCTIF